MNGQFMIEREIERAPAPWGTFRLVSDPVSTSARQITGLDVKLVPGKGHSFHKHPDQEEVIYVLAGKVEQWIEGEKRILGPGDAAFIPAGVVHASFNAGQNDARLYVVFSPCVGEGGFVSVELGEEMPWKALRN